MTFKKSLLDSFYLFFKEYVHREDQLHVFTENKTIFLKIVFRNEMVSFLAHLLWKENLSWLLRKKDLFLLLFLDFGRKLSALGDRKLPR